MARNKRWKRQAKRIVGTCLNRKGYCINSEVYCPHFIDCLENNYSPTGTEDIRKVEDLCKKWR